MLGIILAFAAASASQRLGWDHWFTISVHIWLVFWMLSYFLGWGKDDTDQPGMRGKRSGFSVYTDYGTGVQYLVRPFGGTVPRLNPDGTLKTVAVSPETSANPEEETARG